MKSLQSALRTKVFRLALALGLAAFLALLPFLKMAPATGQEQRKPGSEPHILTSKPQQAEAEVSPVKIGEEIVTGAGQRRRVQLGDGSILFVNQYTVAKLTEAGRLSLKAGEVYVEAAQKAPVVVVTPHQELTARASHFDVRADQAGTQIVVARGNVQVKGIEAGLKAGQRLLAGQNKIDAAPRMSQVLDWTRELMLAAESPLIPGSEYAGGSLIAVDPKGQEAKLELRKFHVDVFIEDGFARTTIDQTYFNHEAEQLEGTFYFPLPPDASLSRLAMYVDGVLREGGMAERDHARQTYESIRYYNRDPALFEWVDGSTFKMRVFPIEARQEKRLVLSYSQWLPSLNGQMQYRFPAGHSLQTVKDWSFKMQVDRGAKFDWKCPSHSLTKSVELLHDLVLKGSARDVRTDKDVVVSLTVPDAGNPWFSQCKETSRYFMVKYRPDLSEGAKRQAAANGQRDWVFLFESSGDRDPLLARVQIDVVRHLLHHAGADDRFTILTANTRVKAWSKELMPVSIENIADALAFLENAHLIGALDLGLAFTETAAILKNAANPCLVHLGSGIAAMGEGRTQELIEPIGKTGARYVGVGVGRRWNRLFMKEAARITGGQFTQINPDEPIAWRAFELSAELNLPRLMNVTVKDAGDGKGNEQFKTTFHVLNQNVGHGEEICAIARYDGPAFFFAVPEKLVFAGQLDGKPWSAELAVGNLNNPEADYLPRTWAKLEIDRLLAADALKYKDAIIALSKAMYVMTPFTSLLVLENDDQHAQYKIDFGRKDHWAMYSLPKKIDVVYEPLEGMPNPKSAAGKKPTAKQVLRTLALGGNEVRGALPDQWNQFHGAIPSDHNQIISFSVGFFNGGGPPPMPLSFGESAGAGAISGGVVRFPDGVRLPPLPMATNLGVGRVSNDSFVPTEDYDKAEKLYMQGALSLPTLQQMYARLALDNKPFRGAGQEFRIEALRLEDWGSDQIGGRVTLNGGGSGAPTGVPAFDFANSPRPQRISIGEASLARASLFNLETPPPSNGNDWLYQRPRFNMPASTFFNLVAYAPGMANSLADIEAVIEAEARPTIAIKPGKIDPAANDLFTKARGFGWQSWKLPGDKGQPAMTILFDGSGKYAYENGETASFSELVTCDGQTLLHLYPKLGIGAQRTVSRFHRTDFAEVVPWALPEPADLAHGADLKVIAERTVAVIPHQEAIWTKEIADKKIENVYWLRVHFVFGADGKPAERQLIKMPKNEIVSRRLIGSGGVVKVLDAKGKEVAVIKGELSPATAPNLTPETKDLVVLPLPYRTAAHVLQSMKDPSLANMRFKDGLPLFAAHLAAGDAANANNVFRQVFHSREQRQLGFYVLLAGCGLNLDSQNGDVLSEHLENPVAQYLALHTSPVLRKHASQWAINSDQWHDSALQHLGQTHAILQRWESDKVLKGDPVKVAAEKRRALEYVKKHKETSFAWALLCLMQDRADQPANSEPAAQARVEFHLALAECWDLFKETPALRYAARYERARSLHQAGKLKEARDAYRELYQATLKDNRLPPIDGDFRRCLQVSGPDDPWSQLISETAAHLLDKKHLLGKEQRPMVLALARQVWRIEDQPLAEHLLSRLLEPQEGKKDDKDRRTITLAVIEFLQEKGQIPQADALLQKLLADPKQAERADLWRLAAGLADQRDMPARGIECLEKALELEFRKPQGEVLRTLRVVDLQQVRSDYRKLLNHYQGLADAMAALKMPPPDGFLVKVVRTADRWRALDAGSTQACSITAGILQRLGQRDLGWDYLTTPVGMQPNEAGPWWELAGGLARKGELKLADRAFQAAFEAEPTNAQILWDRAQNLRQAGEEEGALRLYRQLAEGSWQPRFQGLQTQARSRIKGS